MYRYEFIDENVVYEIKDCFVEINKIEFFMNILITNKNILMFQNINKNNVLLSSGIRLPEENELLLSLDFNKINYEVINNNTNILLDEKQIIIYNFDLNNYMRGN